MRKSHGSYSVNSDVSYSSHPSVFLNECSIMNPYTRIPFSHIFIDNIYVLKSYNLTIQTRNQMNSVDNTVPRPIHIIPSPTNDKKTQELKIKRLCVTIFQRMDELELYTQARWFLNLSTNKLKKLYFIIEDIWNYRACLTNESKKTFVTNGTAFDWPYNYIKAIKDKENIQIILLHEFEKFVYQGITKSDCVTASYWILMGLTGVSHEAAAGCPALVQSNY